MADKKYQVFVSSTYRDLIDHRRDIARSILDLGHIPAAMEYFPAMDENQLQYIKRIIDQCDYYVLVLAGKYGSLDSRGVSYTEREYDYARSTGKFILGFPVEDVKKLSREQTENEPEIIKKLESFRDKVMNSRLVRMWQNIHDLDNKVTKALAHAFVEFPQDGWVRTPKNSNEQLLEELNDLRKKNEILANKLELLESENDISIENLKPLTAEHVIYLRIYGRKSKKYSSRQIKISWLDIFMNVAYIIRSRNEDDEFDARLLERLIYRYTNIKSTSVDLLRSVITYDDVETVKIQLTAHGLINIDNRDFPILTSKGKSMYFSNVAVTTK